MRGEIPCSTEQGINSTATGVQFTPNRELIRDNRESIPPWGSERKNGSTAIRSSRGSTYATSLAAACNLASTPTRSRRSYPVERRAFFPPYARPSTPAPLPANPKPGGDQSELPFFTMLVLERGRAASPNSLPNGPSHRFSKLRPRDGRRENICAYISRRSEVRRRPESRKSAWGT